MRKLILPLVMAAAVSVGIFATNEVQASDRIFVGIGDVVFSYGRPYYRYGNEPLYVVYERGYPRYYRIPAPVYYAPPAYGYRHAPAPHYRYGYTRYHDRDRHYDRDRRDHGHRGHHDRDRRDDGRRRGHRGRGWD